MIGVEIRTYETVKSIIKFGVDITAASRSALHSAVQAGTESARHTTLFNNGTSKRRLFTRDSIEGTTNLGTLEGKISAGGASTWLNWGTRGFRQSRSPEAGTLFAATPTYNRFKTSGRKGIVPRFFMNIARDMAEKTLDYGIDFYFARVIGHG